MDTDQYYELNSFDGEPVVLEWKIFPVHTTLELIQEIQKFMNEELNRTPQDFKHRIIFMSMYNDIDWTRKDNREVCLNNSSNFAEYAKNCSKDIEQFSDLDVKSCGTPRFTIKQMDYGTQLRKLCWIPAKRAVIRCSEETCPLPRAPLKSKGGRKTSINFDADPHTAELLLLTIVSVNQLSIYGAVADWCQELTQRAEAHLSQSTGRPVAKVSDDGAPEVPSEVVSCLTQNSPQKPQAEGDLVEKYKNFTEDLCGDSVLSVPNPSGRRRCPMLRALVDLLYAGGRGISVPSGAMSTSRLKWQSTGRPVAEMTW